MAVRLREARTAKSYAPYHFTYLNDTLFVIERFGKYKMVSKYNPETLQFSVRVVYDEPYKIEALGNNLILTDNNKILAITQEYSTLSTVDREGAFAFAIHQNRYVICTTITTPTSGLYIYDYNNPQSPSLVSSLTDSSFQVISDIKIDGNTAVLASFLANKVIFVNIQTVSNPSITGYITIDAPSVIAFDANYYYIISTNTYTLTIVQKSTKEIVKQITNLELPSYVIDYDNNHFLVSSYKGFIYSIKKQTFFVTNKIEYHLGSAISYIRKIADTVYAMNYGSNTISKLYTEVCGIDYEMQIGIKPATSSSASGIIGKEVQASFHASIETYDYTDFNVEKKAFASEIAKPTSTPCFRVFLKRNNIWNDITHNIVNVSEVLYQSEQNYEVNHFYANNVTITTQRMPINRRDEVKIKVGYIIEKKEYLNDFFLGYVDSITERDDGTLDIDVVSVHGLLQDTKLYDIAEKRTERAYGGNAILTVSSVDMLYRKTIWVSGDVSAFPSSGYISIQDGIFYYGSRDFDAYRNEWCFRNVIPIKKTTTYESLAGSRIFMLLDNLEPTEGVKFQIPLYPCKVEQIETSDGIITILPAQANLLTIKKEERKKYCVVDEDNGIIEFGDVISDNNSVMVTYLICPQNMSCKKFLEYACKKINIPYSIDDAQFYDYNNRTMTIPIGRPYSVLYDDKSIKVPNNPCRAIDVDAEGRIYIGVADMLIMYDGQYNLISRINANVNIIKIKVLSAGDIFVIARPDHADNNSLLYRYSRNTNTWTIVSSELHYFDTVIPYYNEKRWCQWYSIEEDENNLYVLYKTGQTTGIALGIMKVNKTDNTTTKYQLPTFYNDWSRETYKSINFTKTGSTFSVFCLKGNAYTIGWYELDADGNYTHIGDISLTNFIPLPVLQNLRRIHIGDMVYNASEQRIYFNVLFIEKYLYTLYKYGILASIKKNETVKQVITYTQKKSEAVPDGKISGLVYSGTKVYGIRGAEYASDMDGSDGCLYEIANNNYHIVHQSALKKQENIFAKEKQYEMYLGTASNIVAKSDKFYYIANDAFSVAKGQYSIVTIGKTLTPIVKNVSIRDNLLDIINEIAVISGAIIGADKQGRFLFKSKSDVVMTALTGALSKTSSTAYVVSTDKFPNDGYLQIDNEIVYYSTKGYNYFEIERGQFGSNIAEHSSQTPVYYIDTCLTSNDRLFINGTKRTNYEEIYQIVEVLAGDRHIVIDKEMLREFYLTPDVPRRLSISSKLLDNNDVYLAQNIAYRYYQLYKEHHPIYELTISFNPSIDILNVVSIFYELDDRINIEYEKARVRRIALDLRNYTIRLTCVGNVQYFKNYEGT